MNMERYTFSQFMSSLIKIESMITDFYKDLAEKIESGDLHDMLVKFTQESLKRLESLNRVTQLSIVEFSLEHITGLNLEDYVLHVDRVIKDERYNAINKATMLENIMQELYSQASKKTTYASPDASELLERFSQESSKRKLKLLRLLQTSKTD